MKTIDLYNKMVNKEELPKKIKLKGYDNIFTLREDYTNIKWYGEINTHEEFCETIHKNLEYVLNLELEILDEEDKIEKLNDILRVDDLEPPYDFNLQKIWCQTIKNHNKINEIIDRLNKENDER